MKVPIPHLCFLALLGAVSARAGSATDPWEDASRFLVQDAHRAFASAREMDESEARFGEAITLLNLQPRTQGNIHNAIRLLTALAESTPRDNPLNPLARFFRARANEFFLNPPRTQEARAGYLELIRESTGNPVIELGAARLVTMAAFANAPRTEILSSLRELESLRGYLTTKPGLREFLITMGYAILDNEGDPARAIDFFREADSQKLSRNMSSLRLWLTAGQVAASSGRKEDAIHFFQRVIENYPRDPRVYTVRQEIKRLESTDG